ncbi:OmpA family protein [Myxococcota bacterium]|nr:OmpA family protein [Myxococcota bacterium]
MELRLVFLAGLIALAAACKTTPDADANAAGRGTGSEFDDAGAGAGDGSGDSLDANASGIAPIYFDLDQSDIKPQFEPVLESAAATLKSSGGSAVIEGHCDERGSDEYNVALGERRAVSVRKYLYNLGVPVSQISVVSYGEARPAVSGTGETAWSLNRRAEIKLQ